VLSETSINWFSGYGASWFLIDIAGETKEGFYLGLSIPDSDEPLYGPNQYPSSGKLA